MKNQRGFIRKHKLTAAIFMIESGLDTKTTYLVWMLRGIELNFNIVLHKSRSTSFRPQKWHFKLTLVVHYRYLVIIFVRI